MPVELRETEISCRNCGRGLYDVLNTTDGSREEPLCISCQTGRFAQLIRFARIFPLKLDTSQRVKLPEGVNPDGTRTR